jgi:hypothetical protein
MNSPSANERLSEREPARDIPEPIRRLLRQEAGFGCPVPDCANPYLEYHHFDPPWHKERHHDPHRMIALCAMHHAQAEGWTVEQVRAMKKASVGNRPEIAGRFNWMREKILGVVGGNFFYDLPQLIVQGGDRVIWFNRDESGLALLNIQMLTLSNQSRIQIRDNDWISRGRPLDLRSPPKGNKLIAKYSNGDYLAVVFRNHGSMASLSKAHPNFPGDDELGFPLVTVAVTMRVAGSDFDLSPTKATLTGGNQFIGGYFKGGEIGFQLPRILRVKM